MGLTSSSLLLKAFGVILLLVTGLFVANYITNNINEPTYNQEDAYYTETVQIIIERNSTAQFSLYLPVIYTNDSITPSLQNLTALRSSSNNTDLQWKKINDTQYMEINSTSQMLNLTNSISLEPIPDNTIAYESFLFDHEFAGGENITLVLDSNSTLFVSYQLRASTNLCSMSSGGFGTELQPGMIQLTRDRDSFIYACA